MSGRRGGIGRLASIVVVGLLCLSGCRMVPDPHFPRSAARSTPSSSPSSVPVPDDCLRKQSRGADDGARTARVFRAVPGPLPAPGVGEVGGVALPAGKLVTNVAGDTVAWIGTELLGEERLTGLIRDLAAAYTRTGLWPLAVPEPGWSGLSAPWSSTGPERPVVDVPDALTVFHRLCRTNSVYTDADYDPPAPPVTVLAPAQPGPDQTPDRLTVTERGSLLLVPVARPADVPAALGWWGATNAQLTGGDVTAVLRSWEDRFGATLVSLGVDTMVLQVARRPTGAEQRTVLAAEHFAFCVDNFEGSRSRTTAGPWPARIVGRSGGTDGQVPAVANLSRSHPRGHRLRMIGDHVSDQEAPTVWTRRHAKVDHPA